MYYYPDADFPKHLYVDFLYGKTPAQRARQELSFTFFIHQSLAHKKLVEVHTRHAKQESIALLLKHEARDVLLHWFSGNKSQIKTIEEQQWVCSVGPTILNSPHVDKFIQSMPLELLALETDSPIPYDATPSDPTWIPRVAEKVARLKEVDLKDVSIAQQRIFKRFFG
jgi:TatD DNase family protein